MIDKQTFVNVINTIENCINYQKDLNKCIRKHKADGYVIQPDCSEVAMMLLHLIMDDKDNLISEYCIDLEFGKKNVKQNKKSRENTNCYITTPEDLYDFLTKSE